MAESRHSFSVRPLPALARIIERVARLNHRSANGQILHYIVEGLKRDGVKTTNLERRSGVRE